MYILLSIETVLIFTIIIYSLNKNNLPLRAYKYIFLINFIFTLLFANKYEHFLIIFYFLITYLIIFTHIKKLQAIIQMLLTLVITFISDTITTLIFYTFTNITIEKARELAIPSVIVFISMTLIGYFIGTSINRIFFTNILFLKIRNNNKNFNITVIAIVLTLLISYINKVLLFDLSNILSKGQHIFNSLIHFIYCGVLIIIVKIFYDNTLKEHEIEKKNNELKIIQEYSSNLETLYNDMRSFRHDYTNILASISGFINDDDIYGLKEYFDNNISNISNNLNTRNASLIELKNIKIAPLKGIISTKLIMAKEKNININIEITELIENINIDILEVCIITGILLDNAIEAADKSDNKLVQLALINKSNCIMLVIKNSCNNINFPISNIYIKGFSTKGANRGLGLSNLKSIIDKYTNITIDTSYSDETFSQILSFK